MEKYDWLKCSAEGFGGWTELLENCFEELNNYIIENDIKGFEIIYIKEKYGGLRIDFYGGDEHINDLLSEIEKVSYYICEKCGHTGKLRDLHRYRTLCNKCYEEQKKEID